MDSKLTLFSISALEKGRIKEATPDPMNLTRFNELDNLVTHSLAPQKALPSTPIASNAAQMQTKSNQRPFEDLSLVQKLIQFRNQIPTSSRIIRASDS